MLRPTLRPVNRSLSVALCCLLLLALQSTTCVAFNSSKQAQATVTVRTSRVLNRFDPSHALGAAVDGKDKGVIDLQLSPQNVEQMRSAGLQSLI